MCNVYIAFCEYKFAGDGVVDGGNFAIYVSSQDEALYFYYIASLNAIKIIQFHGKCAPPPKNTKG